ncbi:MAG: hypothetical protein Q9175_000488 [Cornicularia normoerica]
MPSHQFSWPQWILEEKAMFVWFSALGLETLDIANLVAYRLRRPPRRIEGFWSQVKTINQQEAGRGRPRLCNGSVVDWDRAAVDNFLINLTDDTDLLEYLLYFGHEHIWLLDTFPILSSTVPSALLRQLDNTATPSSDPPTSTTHVPQLALFSETMFNNSRGTTTQTASSSLITISPRLHLASEGARRSRSFENGKFQQELIYLWTYVRSIFSLRFSRKKKVESIFIEELVRKTWLRGRLWCVLTSLLEMQPYYEHGDITAGRKPNTVLQVRIHDLPTPNGMDAHIDEFPAGYPPTATSNTCGCASADLDENVKYTAL